MLIRNLIRAPKGAIAKTVILPGDPLRSKHFAETFLQDVHCYSEVYGLFGYTGTYQGVPVSIQTSGMGTTAMTECAHQLIENFGCENLIRVGSCASNHEKIHVGDVILSTACACESNCNVPEFGNYDFVPTGDFELMRIAYAFAKEVGIPLHVGVTGCYDLLYRDLDEIPLLCSEMEGAALLSVAARYPHVKAMLLMTCGSHLTRTDEFIPAAKRSQGMFDSMMKLALEVAVHRNGGI